MKSKGFLLRTILPGLLLTAPLSLSAKDIFVGGPRKPGHARPPIRINVTPASAPYTPAQIRHVYGFDQLTADGSGQKIAIVDAYGNGSIQTDLNTFCAQFGLASTTIQILGPNATVDTGWALETALDVEWAHVIAPNATIILSVAPTASLGDLLNAVNAAVNAGADVVSMSWGTTEFSGESTYDPYFQAPSVTFVASSGDNGELNTKPEVEWPAVSPYVIGVGGTTLSIDSSANRISEVAWASGGGGLSSYYSRPSWQNSWSGYSTRGVPDVSYNADPNSGVYVYDAANGGWYEVGGTSAGAPQWAGAIALANQSRSTGVAGNPDVYTAGGTAPAINSANIFDVTSGSNGSDTDDQAVTGYDLVTGLGSPVATGLVPALVALAPLSPDFSISLTPASQAVTPGGATSYTVNIGSLAGFSGAVSLTVSGLPTDATVSLTANPVTAPGTSTLSITAGASTGTFTITVTGTSGSLTHTATATLIIGNPDFSIAASPASASVRHGKSTSYTVTVTPSGGFTGTVGLNATVSPAVSGGPRLSFNPQQITGGSGTSRLSVSTSQSTPRTTYTITITGTSGSTQHSASVSLQVY